jgi:hypothetical protein
VKAPRPSGRSDPAGEMLPGARGWPIGKPGRIPGPERSDQGGRTPGSVLMAPGLPVGNILQVPVDGPPGEAVEHDPAQELRVRLLDLLRLRCNVPGKTNGQVDGAGFPHGRVGFPAGGSMEQRGRDTRSRVGPPLERERMIGGEFRKRKASP